MRKSILTIAMLAFLVSFFNVTGTVNAQAGPSVYTVAWSHTHMYSTNPLIYELSGLDTSWEYVFTFAKADVQSGNPTEIIGTVGQSGAATANLVVGINGTDVIWPDDYTGPIVVYDNFGQITSRHFLAPAVEDFANPTDWESATANTLDDDKVAIGVPNHQAPCLHPAYNDENADGWHHTYLPCSVQTARDGFMLLHYRMDAADYGNHDEVHFYQMPGTTEVAVFDLDQLVDINDGGWSTGITALHYESYVVVNMNGAEPDGALPFIDNFHFDANTGSGYDNPGRTSFALGAYNCSKTTVSAGAWVSDCESPMLVSNVAPNLNIVLSDLGRIFQGTYEATVLNEEWQLDLNLRDVVVNGIQTVEQRQYTEEIWDAYNGSYNLGTPLLGDIDTDIYAFTESRFTSFNVTGVPTSDVLLWVISPSGINSGSMSTTDAHFTMIASFNIVDTGEFTDKLQDGLERLHLDTPLGNIAGLIGLILIAMAVFAGVAHASGMPGQLMYFGQVMIYLAFGGMWIYFGLATTFTTIVFVGSALVLMVVFWLTIKGSSSGNEEIL